MRNKNLLGLVLCAGRSERMRIDKSTIKYHGEEQRYYLYKMLLRFCDKVLLSVNQSQIKALGPDFNYILDAVQFEDAGPMAGLVTAHQTYKDKNILVIACDYPMLQDEDIEKFLAVVVSNNKLSAFYNQSTGYYEPLLAYYPTTALSEIESLIYNGKTSLHRYLQESDAQKFENYDCLTLRSVDDIERSEEIKQNIQSNKKNA